MSPSVTVGVREPSSAKVDQKLVFQSTSCHRPLACDVDRESWVYALGKALL
ncbi:hypothetical protein L873DRAFT_1823186, partial [Choiromyces venosus 120613-1]